MPIVAGFGTKGFLVVGTSEKVGAFSCRIFKGSMLKKFSALDENELFDADAVRPEMSELLKPEVDEKDGEKTEKATTVAIAEVDIIVAFIANFL